MNLASLLLATCLLGLALPPSRAAEPFGYTEAYRTAKMSFAEPGVIVELPVKVGDRVHQGQILARLDYKVLEQEHVMAAEQLRIRQLRHDRLLELQKKGHVPLEEFERAKADLVIDQAKVERIRAQLENRTLRAPFAGVVSEVKREIAESISLQNAHILTIVETNRLLVNLHLPPEIAAKFQPGSPTELTLNPNRRVGTTVEFVSPVIDAASRTVHVRFVIPNAAGSLRVGERVDLHSTSRPSGNTLASSPITTPTNNFRRNPNPPTPDDPAPTSSVDPLPPPRALRELSR